MPTRLPIIFFSGMGADARMFAHQRAAFPELVVPDWLPPRRGETLRQYAGRMAGSLDRGRPFFVGGASFGGFLALEMLPDLPSARGCFLIGAVRSPAELPWWVRMLRPVRAVARVIPFRLAFAACGLLADAFGRVLPRRMAEFLRLGESLDPAFFAWAAEAVLTWGRDGPPPEPTVPVHHIHGRRDRVLPARFTTPDALVPDGGHVIALSNPAEVNAFVRRCVDADMGPESL